MYETWLFFYIYFRVFVLPRDCDIKKFIKNFVEPRRCQWRG